MIAPAFAPLLFALIATLQDPGWVFSYGAPAILGVVAFLGYAGFVVFGVPVVMVLKRLKRLSPASLGLAGFVAGMIVQFVFYRIYGLIGVSEDFSYTVFLYGGVHGCLVALIFSLIAGTAPGKNS